jgi:hypothetical protein
VSDESDKYHELLGVAPGASGRELKQAYHDLAKVWHPDRFSHDPRLQQKAQEKLKEINEAYERLKSGRAATRTRPDSPPGRPAAAPAADVTRRRRRFILPTALAFCAVFFAALSALLPQGARGSRDRTAPAAQSEARPDDEGRPPDVGGRPATAQPARGKERAGRQPPPEATPGDAPDAGPGAPPLRPLPTVTVKIDATTGQLATRDCTAVSRMTYPAGSEPRQYCTAPHKTKAAAQAEPARAKGSRLKAVGKALAGPFN